MASYKTFDLLFIWDKEDGASKFDAIAEICLGTRYSCGDYKGHEDTISLTPRCVTLEEFDGQVERLKKELDDVAIKTRKKFAELGEFRKAHSIKS